MNALHKKILFLSFFCLVISTISYAQSGQKWLNKAAEKMNGGTEAPEGEGTIKFYSDASRSTEITSFGDGTTKLYCRAYIWKAAAKSGKSPYKPLEANYCIEFREGNYIGKRTRAGISYFDIKADLDGYKSFSDYTKTNDYVDFEVDFYSDERFLSVAAGLEEKEHSYTVSLAGECFKYIAEGVITMDLSAGSNKYKSMELEKKGDITVPTCLIPNDTKIRALAKSILKSHYGFEVIKPGDKLYFYEDWVPYNSTERYRRVAVTRKDEDGNCHYGEFKLWSKLTSSGVWQTYETNEWSMELMKCENLE